MLRPAILLTALLLSPNLFPPSFAPGAFQSPDPSWVEAEDYAVYSAFINHKYIPSYSTPIYTLQGELIEDGELDEKGLVVIAANSVQQFVNIVGVSRYLLELFVGRETYEQEEELFDDLIGNSTRAARLRNEFNLEVRYELAGDKELDQELHKLKRDRDRFLDRFPRSKGLLSFSRVGYDAARSKAVFLVNQLDVNSRDRNPSEPTYLVMLKKENGQWKVNRIWGPERKSFVINLARCDMANHHISLPLGSETLSVKGREGDRCVIEHLREREQGYIRRQCLVPVELDKLTIFEGRSSNVFTFSTDLSKYCDKGMPGNHFLDTIRRDRVR